MPKRDDGRRLKVAPDEILTTSELENLEDLVRRAFADTPRPSNDALRNSSQSDEPFLVEEEFADKLDWRSLTSEFLDQAPDGFASALSFFTGPALRFFLPAYLLADLDCQLERVNPAFHLWYGLDDSTRSQTVNLNLYGERTWYDEVAERFAGFSLVEVQAVIAYLRFKASRDEFEREQILQALRNYWEPRSGRGG